MLTSAISSHHHKSVEKKKGGRYQIKLFIISVIYSVPVSEFELFVVSFMILLGISALVRPMRRLEQQQCQLSNLNMLLQLCRSPKYLGYLPAFPPCSLSSHPQGHIFLYYPPTYQHWTLVHVEFLQDSGLHSGTRKVRGNSSYSNSKQHRLMAPVNTLSLDTG